MSQKHSAWETVQMARDPKRITAQYIIRYVFTDFLEMHGDKLFADDAAVIGVGFVAAFVAAVLVVRSLLEFVSKRGYAPFAYWRIIVGTLGLIGLYVYG